MPKTKIEILRRKQKLTRKKLAEMLGVTPQSIYMWERGKSNPKYNNLIELCKIFNTSINNILSNYDDEKL